MLLAFGDPKVFTRNPKSLPVEKHWSKVQCFPKTGLWTFYGLEHHQDCYWSQSMKNLTNFWCGLIYLACFLFLFFSTNHLNQWFSTTGQLATLKQYKTHLVIKYYYDTEFGNPKVSTHKPKVPPVEIHWSKVQCFPEAGPRIFYGN